MESLSNYLNIGGDEAREAFIKSYAESIYVFVPSLLVTDANITQEEYKGEAFIGFSLVSILRNQCQRDSSQQLSAFAAPFAYQAIEVLLQPLTFQQGLYNTKPCPAIYHSRASNCCVIAD